MARIVTFGEIMARVAAPGHQRFRQAMPGSVNVTFAGAEASIAASIAYLGGDAAFVTALPKHEVADACVANLRSVGIDTQYIVRPDEGRLGIYFLEQGINQRPTNVIYDRDGSSVAILDSESYDWDAIFHGAGWFVISGITPAISKVAADVTIYAVQKAKLMGLQVACDMNYRSKLWRWDPTLPPRELAQRTMHEIMPFVDLFIGGRDDIVETLQVSDHPELDSLAANLLQTFPNIQMVAIPKREASTSQQTRYAGMLYHVDLERSFHAPYDPGWYEVQHIVDRLGAGDAFTAGLLFALTTAELSQPQPAIEFATAAGCLAHSVEGDFNFSSRAEIETLMRGAGQGRVNR